MAPAREVTAKRPRLKRADCSAPGLQRRRRGRGFQYLDACGEAVEDEGTLARVSALGIPPAWKDVWICPDPMGHLQATGIDAAGRKQYLYHEQWRTRRDREKFTNMVAFAKALPKLRRVSDKALRTGTDLERERVLAAAIRMLDRGFFRVGSEEYANDNETYGLATIRKDHVEIADGVICFDYVAKSGKQRLQELADDDLLDVVKKLKRRRGGGEELLAYRNGRGWCDVKSTDLNDYIKRHAGETFSAKDFRTWNATVLAAVVLAQDPGSKPTKTARKRQMSAAVKQVAQYLGNTPAVCRASYIDPRIFDRYLSGLTIGGALSAAAQSVDPADLAARRKIEEAVLDLLHDEETSDAIADIGSI